jgi:hypothetical protein
VDVESNKLATHRAHAASIDHLLRRAEEIVCSQIDDIAYCHHVDERVHEPACSYTISEVQGLS